MDSVDDVRAAFGEEGELEGLGEGERRGRGRKKGHVSRGLRDVKGIGRQEISIVCGEYVVRLVSSIMNICQ